MSLTPEQQQKAREAWYRQGGDIDAEVAALLVQRLLRWKHTVPISRVQAEMIEDMREAADTIYLCPKD